MQNYGVVNAAELSSYATEDLGDGTTALSRAVRFLKGLPGVRRVCALVGPGTSDQARRLLAAEGCELKEERGTWSLGALLSLLSGLSGEQKTFIYIYGDCPLMAPGIAERMLANHERYFAQYTFADGYPHGMAPEIVSGRALPSLERLAADRRDQRLERSSLFDLINRDINAFDVETEVSPRDLRLLRVSLTCDTKRNFLLVTRVLKRAGDGVEELVLRALEDEPEMLRTLPAFYNVQLVEGCPQNCSYCPYPGMRRPEVGRQGEMPPDRFRELLDRIQEFSEDAVVGISLWGEPALHSGVVEIIEEVTSRDRLDLLIETSGVGWDTPTLERLAGSVREPPTWIVSLDAWDEQVYERLRGKGYREATATAERLLELFPDHAYVQAVRMTDNEEDLERFYKGWRRRTENVIIQKYDSFCGRLEDRRVTDLSPLKRFPCWHNKRDVVILMNGDAPLCREDTGRTTLLGNVWKDGLEAIWKKGHEIYMRHVRGDYPALCGGCDEYYTFNF